jgi:hypothetical protein
MAVSGQDPLFLQIKEAQASVLEDFAGKSGYADSGERVVAGQHPMQAYSAIFLGWRLVNGLFDGVGRAYCGRQLKDWKESAEVERMAPAGMVAYGRLRGRALARAHARWGDRIAIASYPGGTDAFDRALTEFAEAHADQNDADFAALQQAVRHGCVEAQPRP